MVGRFDVRCICGGFFYGSLGEWGDRRFIFFLGHSLDLLEVRDCKRGLLERKYGFQICVETYSNM